MERRWDLDLTYVTERILAAAFPARPDEQRHRGHLRELAHVLQSKHWDKYLVRSGSARFDQWEGRPGGPNRQGYCLPSIPEMGLAEGGVSVQGRGGAGGGA